MPEPTRLGVCTRRKLTFFTALGLLLLLAFTSVGCSPQNMAQAATATAAAVPSLTVANPTPLASPTSTAIPGTPGATVTTPQADATTSVTAAVTGTPGTPTVRPTPSGTPPNPLDVLNVFNFVNPLDLTLVKSDVLPLNGNSGPGQVFYTISTATQPITQEEHSALSVLSYDPVYREWTPTWSSEEITGTASPLPLYSQPGGYNGGDLVHAGAPILVLRTTERAGHARLALWRWDKQKNAGEPLKMTPVVGGAERDAIFDADLDINMADLDNDGVYEVVADNLKGVQVWKWDGSKFVPQGGR
ncbi:MAG: hypothetical protein IVW55_08300 [Chloroflexi bacterium]|nr:hypothetical protein [Chloroflexota bacterium]